MNSDELIVSAIWNGPEARYDGSIDLPSGGACTLHIYTGSSDDDTITDAAKKALECVLSREPNARRFLLQNIKRQNIAIVRTAFRLTLVEIYDDGRIDYSYDTGYGRTVGVQEAPLPQHDNEWMITSIA